MRTTPRKLKIQNRKAYDYKGEKAVFRLLFFLNNRPARTNVHKIVRGLKRLDRMKLNLNWDWYQREEAQKWRRFKKQGEVVTKRLAKYDTRPAIATNELVFEASKHTPGAPVQFHKVHDFDAFAWVRHPSAPFVSLDEIFAVTTLEQVVKNGWLWKLGVCKNTKCERWFWARKNNQLFCSATRCRQKRWDTENVERRRARRLARLSSRI